MSSPAVANTAGMTDQLQDQHARSFRADMAAYARARPGYPDAAVDWLLPAGAVDVVDLGAGTGQLTRSLVARGLRVTAVDPSASMRAALSTELPGVPVLDGSGESIPVPDASADAVLCAQAWHWVDPPAAGAEVARVLRPGGVLGLVWNTRDTSGRWGRDLDRLLRPAAGQVPTSGHIAAAGHIPAAGQLPAVGEGTPDVRAPLRLERGSEIAWVQYVDPAGLVDLVASRSYVLVLDDTGRRRVLDAAADLARRWADDTGSELLGIDYVTRSWRAIG